jgi:hypothetical protein
VRSSVIGHHLQWASFWTAPQLTPGKCKTVFCFGHQSLFFPLWMATSATFAGAIFAHLWLKKQ